MLKKLDLDPIIFCFRARIFFARPETNSIDWVTFVKLFTFDVWIAIILTFLLSVSIWSLTAYIWYEGGKFDVVSGIIMAFGCLCNQGLGGSATASVSEPISSKLILLSMLGFSQLLLTFYAGVLTSFLSVSRTSLPFRDLTSLHSSTDFIIGTIPGSNFYSLFEAKHFLEFQSSKIH